MSDLQLDVEQSASRAADRFSAGELLSSTVEELVQAVVDECVPGRIELDLAGHKVSREQVAVPARTGLEFAGIAIPGAGQGVVPGLRFDLHIPYQGPREIFIIRPGQYSNNPPRAFIREDRLVITLADRPVEDAAQLQSLIDEREAELAKWVGWLNTSLDGLEQSVRDKVRAQLNRRRGLLNAGDQILAALNVPIRHVDADQALELPVRPKRTVPSRQPASGSPSRREWTLSEAIYEQVIGTITGFTRALERRPASAHQLLPDEETLRDWLMFLLNANYQDESGGDVFIGGETVNGKGKTDILVRHEDNNAFIGECKFWKGPSKFDEAIDQLLGYIVWRDTKAALVVFITQKDATAVIEKADERLRAHGQFVGALPTTDPTQRRDYRFRSPHDDQRIISIALLPVVVPQGDPV